MEVGTSGARAAGHVESVAAGTAIVKDESAEVRRGTVSESLPPRPWTAMSSKSARRTVKVLTNVVTLMSSVPLGHSSKTSLPSEPVMTSRRLAST